MNIVMTPRTRTSADLVPPDRLGSTRYERQMAGASRIIIVLPANPGVYDVRYREI